MDLASSEGASPVAPASIDVALDEARALLAEAESELGRIEQTIDGLGLGTHASCSVCGGPIEPERLIASPTARRCAKHAESG